MYMQLHIHVGAIASSCSSKEIDLLGLKKSAPASSRRRSRVAPLVLLTLKPTAKVHAFCQTDKQILFQCVSLQR